MYSCCETEDNGKCTETHTEKGEKRQLAEILIQFINI